MGSTFTGVPVIALDDNLANGKTYTFQFKCANWFCLTDLSPTLQSDINAQAPNFIQSLQVTSPPTTSLYNVQFTYEGDGSDVVSDVAMSIVAACKAVSNDDIVFIGAVQAASPDIVVTPSKAAQATEQAVADATSKVANDATKAATDAINTALKGLMPLLIVAVLLILFVVPSFLKSTGTRISAGA
jgi:hypothetical protein